jgi:hypothetical protein
MKNDLTSCLYCYTKNESKEKHCSNCGMALAKDHPENYKNKTSFFVKAFWGIVIFCIVMVYYLPR